MSNSNACGDPPFGPSPYQPSETWPTWPYPGPPALVPVTPVTPYHFTPIQPLSDADVERIARRLAEILKERP